MQFVNPPDYSLFAFDPAKFELPILTADAERTLDMFKAAEAIACIWIGRLPPSHANGTMHPDVVEQNLLFGTKRLGRDAFIEAVQEAHKASQPWLISNICISMLFIT